MKTEVFLSGLVIQSLYSLQQFESWQREWRRLNMKYIIVKENSDGELPSSGKTSFSTDKKMTVLTGLRKRHTHLVQLFST